MRITRRHHAALSIAAVLAAGSLTLTACGNSADPATAGSGSPATVTSVDGQQISLPANGKPTAVFFFSVGCGECVNGVRSLGEAATTPARGRGRLRSPATVMRRASQRTRKRPAPVAKMPGSWGAAAVAAHSSAMSA